MDVKSHISSTSELLFVLPSPRGVDAEGGVAVVWCGHRGRRPGNPCVPLRARPMSLASRERRRKGVGALQRPLVESAGRRTTASQCGWRHPYTPHSQIERFILFRSCLIVCFTLGPFNIFFLHSDVQSLTSTNKGAVLCNKMYKDNFLLQVHNDCNQVKPWKQYQLMVYISACLTASNEGH